jgi:hypothetical protein
MLDVWQTHMNHIIHVSEILMLIYHYYEINVEVNPL